MITLNEVIVFFSDEDFYWQSKYLNESWKSKAFELMLKLETGKKQKKSSKTDETWKVFWCLNLHKVVFSSSIFFLNMKMWIKKS